MFISDESLQRWAKQRILYRSGLYVSNSIQNTRSFLWCLWYVGVSINIRVPSSKPNINILKYKFPLDEPDCVIRNAKNLRSKCQTITQDVLSEEYRFVIFKDSFFPKPVRDEKMISSRKNKYFTKSWKNQLKKFLKKIVKKIMILITETFSN